ncbi:MAG: hypothetical protein R3Y46_08390, partial [Opitutales bacterium]
MKKFSLAMLIAMIASFAFAQEAAPQNGDKKGPPPAGMNGEKPARPEGAKGERPERPEGAKGERPERPEGA